LTPYSIKAGAYFRYYFFLVGAGVNAHGIEQGMEYLMLEGVA
jgi:hypothetical protein